MLIVVIPERLLFFPTTHHQQAKQKGARNSDALLPPVISLSCALELHSENQSWGKSLPAPVPAVTEGSLKGGTLAPLTNYTYWPVGSKTEEGRKE
jgi:hypothetical protein